MFSPAFITFEGGEGAGKTTLIATLQKTISSWGASVLATREPGGSLLGEKIRELLLNSPDALAITPAAELLLFLADRVQHIQEIVKPALERGSVVLCDRFNDSTIVYQGIARGLGKLHVQNLCNMACNGFKPDITFYLDIDPALGFERVAKQQRATDRMEDAGTAFHQKVREGFLQIASEEPGRIVVIDASQSLQSVFENVVSHIRQKIDKTYPKRT